MNALVMGAAGFIGRNLGTRLQGEGHGVIGMDLGSTLESARATGALPFDTLDCDVRSEELPDVGSLDAVFYLAQSPHYREFPAGTADLFLVNVVGALRSARAAAAAGARFFCYASSGNVYAPSFSPFMETDPVRRDQPYALSKIAGEEGVALFSGAMAVLRVRFFGVFGPTQRGMLVPIVARRVHEGEPVEIEPHPRDRSDQSGLRASLCYVDDVSACLVWLAEQALSDAALPPVLNVAGPEAVSVRQLACEVARQAGVVPQFRAVSRPREGDLIADISSLRQLLQPRFTPLPEALAKTVAELRS